MGLIYLPGSVTKLPFHVPASACCNCGTTAQIAPRVTPLKKTRYMLFAGTELRFAMDLPYCKRCYVTAERFPVGVMQKLLVAFGLYWVLLMLAIFSPLGSGPTLGQHLPLITGAVALAISFGFYATRQAKAPQTSYYQPVTLKGVRQQFSGSVVGIKLRCSLPSFAEDFADLNRDAIASGALTVTPKRVYNQPG